MADLGQTEKESAMALPSDASKETRYPSLTLRDDNVDKVKGGHDCTVGDEYISTNVRLRVKGISDDEYGSRLEFDVLQMDELTPADGTEYDATEVPKESADDTVPASGKGKKSTKALTYS